MDQNNPYYYGYPDQYSGYQYPGYGPENVPYSPETTTAAETTEVAPTPAGPPSKRSSYIIIIVTAILAVIIAIVLIYLAVSRKGPFARFSGPTSSQYWYPAGAVYYLTDAQIATRKAYLTGATGGTGSTGT